MEPTTQGAFLSQMSEMVKETAQLNYEDFEDHLPVIYEMI